MESFYSYFSIFLSLIHEFAFSGDVTEWCFSFPALLENVIYFYSNFVRLSFGRILWNFFFFSEKISLSLVYKICRHPGAVTRLKNKSNKKTCRHENWLIVVHALIFWVLAFSHCESHICFMKKEIDWAWDCTSLLSLSHTVLVLYCYSTVIVYLLLLYYHCWKGIKNLWATLDTEISFYFLLSLRSLSPWGWGVNEMLLCQDWKW